MGAPAVDVTVVDEPDRRLARAGGWEFSVWRDFGDGELRVRDTDAATRLGFGRPRDVRKLIERIWPENKRPHVRATVARTSMPRGGERTARVDEYWLSQAELLKVCARAETDIAEAVLDDMIRVYIAARLRLDAPSPTPLAVATPPSIDGVPMCVLTVTVPETVHDFLLARAERMGLSRGYGAAFAARHILQSAQSLALGLGVW